MASTYIISDLIGEEVVGTFYEKELPKTNQEEFRAEKLIERKVDKIYVKWKGCNSFFNSCIDRKHIVSMSEYFLKPKSSGRKVKVQLDW